MADYPSLLTSTPHLKTISLKTIGGIYTMVEDDPFKALPN